MRPAFRSKLSTLLVVAGLVVVGVVVASLPSCMMSPQARQDTQQQLDQGNALLTAALAGKADAEKRLADAQAQLAAQPGAEQVLQLAGQIKDLQGQIAGLGHGQAQEGGGTDADSQKVKALTDQVAALQQQLAQQPNGAAIVKQAEQLAGWQQQIEKFSGVVEKLAPIVDKLNTNIAKSDNAADAAQATLDAGAGAATLIPGGYGTLIAIILGALGTGLQTYRQARSAAEAASAQQEAAAHQSNASNLATATTSIVDSIDVAIEKGQIQMTPELAKTLSEWQSPAARDVVDKAQKGTL